MSGKAKARRRAAKVAAPLDPIATIQAALNRPRSTVAMPVRRGLPNGVEVNRNGHTIDPRQARMYKGRLESRDHRAERASRRWHGNEHGPRRRCVACGSYERWGGEFFESTACPECLPLIGEAARVVVQAIMTAAGTWPRPAPSIAQAHLVVEGMMKLAGTIASEA